MYKLTKEQYYKLADTADMLHDYDGFGSPERLKALIDEARMRINSVLVNLEKEEAVVDEPAVYTVKD